MATPEYTREREAILMERARRDAAIYAGRMLCGMTLRELGEIFDISGPRVRQICAKQRWNHKHRLHPGRTMTAKRLGGLSD